MPEESGGDPIGKLQVDILGNLSPLEQSLQRAEQLLQQYDKKLTAVLTKEGRMSASGKKALKSGFAPAGAVGVATPGVVMAENVKISANAKVNGKDIAKDVQRALDATVFKLNIDVANLRAQIQRAFDGVGMGNITASGHTPTERPSVGAAVGRGSIPDSLRSMLSQADARGKGKNSKLSQAVDDFYDLIADGLNTSGKANLPHAGEVGKSIEKLYDLMDTFGDDISSWTKVVNGKMVGGSFTPQNLQKLGLGKDTASLASGTGKILAQRLATSGQPLLEGVRAIRLTGGGPVTAPVSHLPSSVGAFAAPRGAVPRETPRDELVKDALQALRQQAFFATPVTGPSPVTDAGKGRRRLPSERIAGTVGFPTSGAPTGEEDAQALRQLGGGNRANVRRLRGRGQRGGAFPVDLEPFLRALERGDYRNVVETDKGDLRNLESRGNTPGDLLESDATIRELKRRSGGRKLTLPNSGIEGQVKFLKPQDVVRRLLTERIGGSNAGEQVDALLADPTIAAQISKATLQGGTSKIVPGGRPAGNYAPGAGPAANARATLRVDELRNKLIPRIDERMSSLQDELEGLQGSGNTRRTDKVEQMLARAAKRRQDLHTQLEETLPYADRRLSPADARVIAAQDKLASGESRARVGAGFGLTSRERLEKQFSDPGFVGADQRRKIQSGLLPDPAGLLKGLDTFQSQGFQFPPGASRRAALFSALKPHIDEAEGQIKDLKGDDRRMGRQLIGDAVGSIFREVQFHDDEANKDLPSDNSRGRGRVPRRVTGGTRTGASTKGGASEMIPDYERPSTSLDVERQGLGVGLDAAARRVAERRLAALKADRAASGVKESKGDPIFDKKTVDDFLLAPPVKTAGGRTVPRGIRPDVMAEVESSTDVGKRAAQIRATQGFADKFVGSLSRIPDIQTQRKAASQADLINLPSGVDPAEAKREIGEILASRTAQSARRPSTRDTKDPVLSDVLREKFVGAGGFLAGGGGNGFAAGGGGEGGGSAFGGRLPIPLPVVITGPFPLRVDFIGGTPRGRSGGGSATDRLKDSLDGDVIKPGRLKDSQRANVDLGVAAGGTLASGGAVKPDAPPNLKSLAASGKTKNLDVDFLSKFMEIDREKTPKRRGDTQHLDDLTADIKANGFKEPLELNYDETGGRALLGDGNHRLAAARRLGINKIPTRVVPTDLSGEAAAVKYPPPLARSGNQGGPINFLDAPPYKIGHYPLTMAEPTGLGRQRQAALVAENKRMTGGRFNSQDAEIRGQEQDIADTDLADIRSQLRRAQRSVPKRGFGASITDLVTSAVGGKGFQGQLEHLGRAEREASELGSLSNRQANLRGQARVIQNAADALPVGDTRRTELLKGLTPINEELKKLKPAIATSRQKFDENVKAATKFSTVLRSFGGAAAGGAVAAGLGSVTFGLGLAVTAPIIQAISEGLARGIGPAVERATGQGGTAARVNDDLAQGVIGAGGRTDIALAQHAAQIGLAGPTANKFAGVLGGRAETIAGNQQLQAQVDELNAFINTQKDNAGFRGADKNLSQSVGGFLNTGIGGTPGTGQLVFDNLNGLPDAERQRELHGKLDEDTSLLAASPSKDTTNALYDEIGRIVGEFAETDSRLDYWNKQLAKGGAATAKFSNDVKLSDRDRVQQETALRAANQGGLADLVRKGSLQITDEGKAVTDPGKINGVLEALVRSTKPDVGQLLAAQKDQVNAQEEARIARLNLQTNVAGPAETGLAFAQSGPLAPANTGFVPEDQKKYNAELSKTQAIYDEVNAAGTKDIQIAKDFVQNAFPTGDVGKQFADSLDKVASIGKEISGIQIGVQTQQAAYAAQQYSAQLIVAKRSLSDARGLAGQITGESKDNLGVLERQQFLLQKKAQGLGFQQSQRQINFQTAIAGVTAPGLTGEERAARIEQAKIEAKYAQEQLDIQKKLAALGNKGFEITASRNVGDLVRSIGLLEKGREVTLNTAAAEKRIVGLTKLQDKENKKVAAFYQAALEKTNDMLALSAQLAAATGTALVKVEQQVLETFKATYGGMIDVLNDTATTTSNTSGSSTDEYSQRHARGIVGTATGTTNMTVGEAGNEEVAILRNPRKLMGSFGGGGAVVNITLSGNSFSNEGQYKRLIQDVQEAVEKGMGRRAKQLGLSRP